jgi:hypothetical protein
VQQSLSTLGDPKAQTGITARNNAAMSVPKKPMPYKGGGKNKGKGK